MTWNWVDWRDLFAPSICFLKVTLSCFKKEKIQNTIYLFDKHLLDESERRFIVEDENQVVGIVELVEIN